MVKAGHRRWGLMEPTPTVFDAPPKLMSLSMLAGDYDGVLCDIWGVLHNGVAAFADAVDALIRYRAQGGIVILITNAPRSNTDIYPQLARLGVPRHAFDAIVTSGDVTAKLVQEQPTAPLFHFGPARDQSILDGLTNPMVSLNDAKLCLLTGPLDDDIQSVALYEPILAQMRDLAVKMICANPDLVVRSGDRMVICAGSIAQRYAQMGGAVIYAGKPEAAIYDEARSRLSDLAGRDVSKNRILAIGDGLPTDIKGAAQNGFDACFITGGIHSVDFGGVATADAIDRVTRQIPGLNLVGLCDRLRWT